MRCGPSNITRWVRRGSVTGGLLFGPETGARRLSRGSAKRLGLPLGRVHRSKNVFKGHLILVNLLTPVNATGVSLGSRAIHLKSSPFATRGAGPHWLLSCVLSLEHSVFKRPFSASRRLARSSAALMAILEFCSCWSCESPAPAARMNAPLDHQGHREDTGRMSNSKVSTVLVGRRGRNSPACPSLALVPA